MLCNSHLPITLTILTVQILCKRYVRCICSAKIYIVVFWSAVFQGGEREGSGCWKCQGESWMVMHHSLIFPWDRRDTYLPLALPTLNDAKWRWFLHNLKQEAHRFWLCWYFRKNSGNSGGRLGPLYLNDLINRHLYYNNITAKSCVRLRSGRLWMNDCVGFSHINLKSRFSLDWTVTEESKPKFLPPIYFANPHPAVPANYILHDQTCYKLILTPDPHPKESSTH